MATSQHRKCHLQTPFLGGDVYLQIRDDSHVVSSVGLSIEVNSPTLCAQTIFDVFLDFRKQGLSMSAAWVSLTFLM